MERSRTDIGFVYVMGMPGGPSKIGHSLAPEKRKIQIERQQGCKVVVTGTWAVGLHKALAVERYIHRLLRDKHIRSEWFAASQEEIVAAIDKALNTGIEADYVIPALDRAAKGMRHGQHISTKYPAGTKERIASVLRAGENHAVFIREAIESELERRERAKTPGAQVKSDR